MSNLTLYNLGPSPNNIKVRLALGLKKIPAEIVDVDPMDRSEIVRLSGQPLMPILKDGERIVYDSYGILRYLDANFPGEPRLFAADRERMKEIEGWEGFARNQIGEAIGIMFGQVFSPEKDAAVIAHANTLLAERVPKIEDALDGQPYLMGEQANAADLSVAAMLSTAVIDPTPHPEDSLVRFFGENLKLPKDFDRTWEWIGRVLALDPTR